MRIWHARMLLLTHATVVRRWTCHLTAANAVNAGRNRDQRSRCRHFDGTANLAYHVFVRAGGRSVFMGGRGGRGGRGGFVNSMAQAGSQGGAPAGQAASGLQVRF